MTVSFYGKRADGEAIMLDLDDPAHLNMIGANVRSLLGLMGLEPGDEPYGEAMMPEARRGVMLARATFDRRAEGFTRQDRQDRDTPGKARIIEFGIDADYLQRRLNDFEKFLNAVADKGATSIYWA